MCVWDRSTQLQFVTFNIFTYKISEQKLYKKICSLVPHTQKKKKKKKQKSKQFNLYGKLTKEKFNFDSN